MTSFPHLEEESFDKESLPKSLITKSLELLEWPNLIRQLSSFASTPMGRRAILDFKIPESREESENLIKETIEIYDLENEADQKINFDGVFDIKKNIEICSKNGVISAIDLLEIADTISSSRKLKAFILNIESRPLLSSILDQLVDHIQLEKILKNSIEKSGRISDKASERLADLRDQLNYFKTERRHLLDDFLKKNSKYLQDLIIGDRFGRPVVAVKVNYINKIKGILHDSSSSGNTIFIEPDVIASKGNKIASLNAKISNEEYKLLKKWSCLIAENQNTLLSNTDILLKIENSLTRARYSKWINGFPPQFSNNNKLIITGFTHPLLIWEYKKKYSIQPKAIDFFIAKNIKVVAITGPNTGGKTAALKGLGISCLMAKSGLFIPANSIPIIPYFSYIYSDIGDEQSLEGNLSTFSSHITRIKNILDALNNKNGLSFVLLDEIGSGTDPEEGTALAISLLKEFADKSDLTIATTHYGDVKALKYKDERFENVSVSFDEELFKPTYTLNWGIPGRSNGLSIARKIGLSENIINFAADYLKPKETENINKIIKGLEQQKILQQEAAEEAASLIARTEILHDEINKYHQYQKSKAKEFQEKEREKLTKLISQAKSEVVNLIEKLRNKNASGEDSRIIGERLKEIENNFLLEEDKKIDNCEWSPKVGDFIRIKSLNTTGKIIDSDETGLSFTVNCGSFKSMLSLSDLEGLHGEQPILPKSEIKIKSSQDIYSSSNIRTSKNTVDLRGMRVHEAEIVLEEKLRKFHGPLWIVHGVGTGKLKKGLKLWLSQLDYVEKIEDASSSEGGSGCSIVWIK